MECTQQQWKLKRCALRKLHVMDGQNTRDQIALNGFARESAMLNLPSHLP